MKTENGQVVKRGRPHLKEDELLRHGRIIMNLPPPRAAQVKRLALARNLSYSQFCVALLLPELDKFEYTA